MLDRTLIYVRTSTDRQDTSISLQKESCIAFCKSQGWEHYQIFVDRVSGATLDRPELSKAKAQLFSGHASRLVVHSLDRLGRNLREVDQFLDDLQKNNLTFVSVREQFNSASPAGRMILQILGSFAEFERRLISTRIKDALAQKKKEGVILGRPPGNKAFASRGTKLASEVLRMRQEGYLWKDICAELRISHPTAKKNFLLAKSLKEV